MSMNTRQSERNRLAAHLVASVSYLWVKTLLTIMFGAILGAGIFTTPRVTLPRLVRPPMRVPSV
jgi:hypothetical protein